MQTLIVIPVFSTLLLACDAPAPPTTIRLTDGGATGLVAFRDPPDAAWQTATRSTPTSYEIEVHGPYVVAVACDYDVVPSVTQIGRTLDESHDLGTVCTKPSGSHTVTGQMAQAGTIVFGDHAEVSPDPAWEFQFHVDDGAYDLLAVTDVRIGVRRKIPVTADLTISPAVDLQQGMPLADVAFSAANATAGETLEASVLVGTADSAQAEVYVGPSTTAKVAPEAALTATDNQTVSLRALTATTNAVTGRSVRRPFRVGGDTVYKLPAPLSGVQWAVENHQLGVSWTSRPDTAYLVASASVMSGEGPGAVLPRNSLDLSAAFLAATGITRATFATDIPGEKPAWLVDLTGAYTRELEFQNVTGGVTTSIWVDETLNSATPLHPASATQR